MSDINSNEKISALRDTILNWAEERRRVVLDKAHKDVEAWLAQENEKLDREVEMILAESKPHAEEARRRYIIAAERERSTEALKLQSRLLSEIQIRFQNALVKLREDPKYPDILLGLALEGADTLKGAEPLILRLAGADISLGEGVAQKAVERRPASKMTFDSDPVPIPGGCWVFSADGHRQVNLDWFNRAREMADELAARILPLL